MIWQQSLSASLEVIGAHVFVCFSSKNEHSQVSPCSLSLIFCSSFTDLFHTSYYSTAYSILLISLSSSSHFPPSFLLAKLLLLNTRSPTPLLPCVSFPLLCFTIQQLCPDFSEGLASKKLYLPGQTQNQYPSNANTAHRQFSGSANDAGSYAEFSDYRAEMAKKWVCLAFGIILPPNHDRITLLISER